MHATTTRPILSLQFSVRWPSRRRMCAAIMNIYVFVFWSAFRDGIHVVSPEQFTRQCQCQNVALANGHHVDDYADHQLGAVCRRRSLTRARARAYTISLSTIQNSVMQIMSAHYSNECTSNLSMRKLWRHMWNRLCVPCPAPLLLLIHKNYTIPIPNSEMQTALRCATLYSFGLC